MESFFSSLKTELVHRTRFGTRAEAKAALFECIETFYNHRRLHSSIRYRTPAQARIDMPMAQAPWRRERAGPDSGGNVGVAAEAVFSIDSV